MVNRSGFTPNIRRGTGFVFSAEALNSFLASNHFSHIIRAHEMQPLGASVIFVFKALFIHKKI